MAFHGEVLDACGIIDIDCASVTVVAVSGAGPTSAVTCSCTRALPVVDTTSTSQCFMASPTT